jgi:hypothetical protein
MDEETRLIKLVQTTSLMEMFLQAKVYRVGTAVLFKLKNTPVQLNLNLITNGPREYL